MGQSGSTSSYPLERCFAALTTGQKTRSQRRRLWNGWLAVAGLRTSQSRATLGPGSANLRPRPG